MISTEEPMYLKIATGDIYIEDHNFNLEIYVNQSNSYTKVAKFRTTLNFLAFEFTIRENFTEYYSLENYRF